MLTVQVKKGPYDGQALVLDDALATASLGLPVDDQGAPCGQNAPFGLAIYRRVDGPNDIKYDFHFIKPLNQPFSVVFVDGPAAGVFPAEQPAQYLESRQPIPLLADGSPYQGIGKVESFAIYDRREESGRHTFYFSGIDRTTERVDGYNKEVSERHLQEAMKNFYEAPDYNIYSKKPTGEHIQVPVEVGFRRGHVDEAIAQLIEAVWQLGLDTLGSCQQLTQGENAGKAYIGFPRRDDARRFETVLRHAGIECVVHDKETKLARKNNADGTVAETLTLDAANVLFDPREIVRATEAVERK